MFILDTLKFFALATVVVKVILPLVLGLLNSFKGGGFRMKRNSWFYDEVYKKTYVGYKNV